MAGCCFTPSTTWGRFLSKQASGVCVNSQVNSERERMQKAEKGNKRTFHVKFAITEAALLSQSCACPVLQRHLGELCLKTLRGRCVRREYGCVSMGWIFFPPSLSLRQDDGCCRVLFLKGGLLFGRHAQGTQPNLATMVSLTLVVEVEERFSCLAD